MGPFYPPCTPPTDFLPIYATHRRTVEMDSTYYRIPSCKMVQGWRDRERETQTWVRCVRHLLHRGEIVYACIQ